MRTDFKNSRFHYEKNTIVLRDRITKCDGLSKKINLKIKFVKQKIKINKYNRVRCDICKNDIHRASYSRHLESKEHLEKKPQSKVIIPRKNQIKRVVEEGIKVSDMDTKDEKQEIFH